MYDSTHICVVCSKHMHRDLLVTFEQIGSSFLPSSGNSGCTLALWEMPKSKIILEYNVIVYSGWMLPIWMKIAFEMSICTDCIS